MTLGPIAAVLLIPVVAAVLLAALPGYRLTARINVVATLATFLVALSLFFSPRMLSQKSGFFARMRCISPARSE